MILLIDNYDSFVHNLARYFRLLGQETQVVRHDAIGPAEVLSMRPAAVVLSPGPCTPDEAGCSVEVVRQAIDSIPLLGVCLGHQVLAAALGGKIVHAREPMHGRTSPVIHAGDGLFAGLPSPLVACRYHSLVVDPASVPRDLEITARTSDGTIMALAHRRRPAYGVQFHPEAILTQGGIVLLANFLRSAGCRVPEKLPELDDAGPLGSAAEESPWPDVPVTF